jgi:hypothetical protein
MLLLCEGRFREGRFREGRLIVRIADPEPRFTIATLPSSVRIVPPASTAVS